MLSALSEPQARLRLVFFCRNCCKSTLFRNLKTEKSIRTHACASADTVFAHRPYHCNSYIKAQQFTTANSLKPISVTRPCLINAGSHALFKTEICFKAAFPKRHVFNLFRNMLSGRFKFINVYFGMHRSSAFCSVRNSCVPNEKALHPLRHHKAHIRTGTAAACFRFNRQFWRNYGQKD